MSRYVDPTRHITIVVRDHATDLAAAIRAAQAVLQTLPESYSVRFDDYPTSICLSRGGRVLGHDADGSFDCLLPYGFPKRSALES